MVQVYKSEVVDLILSDKYLMTPLEVFEADSEAKIIGATEYEFAVKTTVAEQLLEVFEEGLENRIVRFPKGMASKTHMLFIMEFVTKKENVVKHGKLVFVDLAGDDEQDNDFED